MLRAVAFATYLLVLALPASAQETVLDPAEIGPDAARDFWCASAYGVASANAAAAGDEVGAISQRESMTVLFQRLLLEMEAGGFSREQYDVLAADTLGRVLDPFRDAADGFDRATCESAVTEAAALLDALAAP